MLTGVEEQTGERDIKEMTRKEVTDNDKPNEERDGLVWNNFKSIIIIH